MRRRGRMNCINGSNWRSRYRTTRYVLQYDSLTSVSFISLLPFPVLGLDQQGCIRESNGSLERELGLGHSLEGRTLVESLEGGVGDVVDQILGKTELDRPVVQLTFAGTANPKSRTFYVIAEDDTRWLVGQPVEFDEQRVALERAHERAEAQTDEYARISQELLAANEQLALRARALV